jgi:thiamine pyrophosphokinase
VDEPAQQPRTVVVVAGGDTFGRVVLSRLALLEPDAITIAADSGIDLAFALGRRVDVAVGDFDSVTTAGLERAMDEGAEIVRHPAAKDATDLELTLDVAVRRGARRLVVMGGHGGRLDHLLANVALLSGPSLASCEVTAHLGPALLTVVRGPGERSLQGEVGELVTLIPQHGDAAGVTTTGLAYPLRDEALASGTSRGVSNLFTTASATVRLTAGVLAVIQPDHHQRPEQP